MTMGLSKNDKKKLKRQIEKLIANTSVSSNSLDFVQVETSDVNFTLIGCGCSSGVFRSKEFPFIAVKLYSPAHKNEAMVETVAYKKVKGIKYFPKLYLFGPNFLAIEYIEGKSLYDCLIEGIEISEDTISQVDDAIQKAKERGLIPSDVHFKNIILVSEEVRIVDLSDYLTAEHVTRWDRLKFFYKTVYKPLLKGIRIPKKVVDAVRKGYKLGEGLYKRFFSKRFD